MKTYLLPYNPLWPDRYKQEAENISSVTPVHLDIHHVGSTAIPGMCAKDCIDILGIVRMYEEGSELIKPLTALGYQYRGEYGIKERHYFAKSENGKVHLHVFPKGSEEIEKHLHFVRVMLGNPGLMQEFAELKGQLVSLYPHDKPRYQAEKAFFYEKVSEITD